jgi:hypothetical protein
MVDERCLAMMVSRHAYRLGDLLRFLCSLDGLLTTLSVYSHSIAALPVEVKLLGGGRALIADRTGADWWDPIVIGLLVLAVAWLFLFQLAKDDRK